jgi:hypothetical protein
VLTAIEIGRVGARSRRRVLEQTHELGHVVVLRRTGLLLVLLVLLVLLLLVLLLVLLLALHVRVGRRLLLVLRGAHLMLLGVRV